nr:hypothetical protein [Brucella intermedia]
MNTLTPKQKEALDFIKGYIATNGYGPSYDEIRIGLGFSSRTSGHRLVHSLVKRGAIEKPAGLARCYSFPKGRAA